MFKLIKDLQGVTRNDVVVRMADNAFIPFDDANSDYVEYKKWLAEGNEPLPADEPTQN